MFNLQPTEKYKLTLPQFAIAQSVDGGPVFGCNDLVLVDQGNVNQSKSEFPICYKSEKLKRGAETSLRFCGSKIGKFLVKEWEVFMVEFEGQVQGVEEEFLKIFWSGRRRSESERCDDWDDWDDWLCITFFITVLLLFASLFLYNIK